MRGKMNSRLLFLIMFSGLSACGGGKSVHPEWVPESASPDPVAVPVVAAAGNEPPLVAISESRMDPIDQGDDTTSPLDPEWNIFFRHGKAELDGPAQTLLGRHARALNENRRKILLLRAYTNDLGSRSLNTVVADQRLSSIKRFLLSKGVRRAQIRLLSSGGETPAKSCRSEACQLRWQRVELKFR